MEEKVFTPKSMLLLIIQVVVYALAFWLFMGSGILNTVVGLFLLLATAFIVFNSNKVITITSDAICYQHFKQIQTTLRWHEIRRISENYLGIFVHGDEDKKTIPIYRHVVGYAEIKAVLICLWRNKYKYRRMLL